MSLTATTTQLVVARVPYLNCAPFYDGLMLGDPWTLQDVSPRRFGVEAAEGRLSAGPLSLADYLRLRGRFERIGNFGVAVRGRCGSAIVFCRVPLRQLDGATIAITPETSTSALLLRLILEHRYQISPHVYDVETREKADAVLLIGDEALAFRAANQDYSYEVDLAFEWWLWQHLPAVFAVWAVRTTCSPTEKQHLSRHLQKQVALNLGRFEALAKQRSGNIGLPAEQLTAYLSNFVYRLSESEERAIKQFEALVHEHHLL